MLAFQLELQPMTTPNDAPARASIEPLRLAVGLFEPEKEDKDFWQYADRCAALIERLLPEAVKRFEWSGPLLSPMMRKSAAGIDVLRDLDPNWRDGRPMFHVSQGCESPILRLEIWTGTEDAARRFGVWTAKSFDDSATVELLVFLTCATSQISFPDSRGQICRTCRGAGRHWTKEAQAVIACADCGARGTHHPGD